METVQFKTNINCSGCVAKVTAPLNEVAGAAHWSVDTADKDKILTVQATAAHAQAIIAAVQQTGFTIERLS
jgi:copper chaperone CopZ